MYRDFPYTSYPHIQSFPHYQHSPPEQYVCYKQWTYIAMSVSWQSPQFTLGSTLGVVYSLGFWSHIFKSTVNTTYSAPLDGLPDFDLDVFLRHLLLYCSLMLYSFWSMGKWPPSSWTWPSCSISPSVILESSLNPGHDSGLCDHAMVPQSTLWNRFLKLLVSNHEGWLLTGQSSWQQQKILGHWVKAHSKWWEQPGIRLHILDPNGVSGSSPPFSVSL